MIINLPAAPQLISLSKCWQNEHFDTLTRQKSRGLAKIPERVSASLSFPVGQRFCLWKRRFHDDGFPMISGSKRWTQSKNFAETKLSPNIDSTHCSQQQHFFRQSDNFPSSICCSLAPTGKLQSSSGITLVKGALYGSFLKASTHESTHQSKERLPYIV